MTLDEIFALWEADSDIDRTEIAEELRKLPKLHGKYYRHYVDERLRLRKLESEAKRLRLAKTVFYSDGPTDDTRAAGWNYPPKGLILKNEVPLYLDADPDVIAMSLRVDVQKEKVDLLDSIIRQLRDRGFNLKTMFEFIRFTNGG